MASHLLRKHPDFDFTELQSVQVDTDADIGALTRQLPLMSDVTPGDDNEEVPISADKGHLLTAKSSALLLLSLKEQHRLTQSAVNFSIGQIKETIAHVLDDVKASVKQRVGEIYIDDCFDVDPFEGLGTEYLQTKFYREHFHLLVGFPIIN